MVFNYVVTALDEKYQESAYSNEVNITVLLVSPVWISIIDNGNGDLMLSWIDNATNFPPSTNGYNIYRKNSSEPIPLLIATIGTPTQNNYTDYGVQNGKWSYYLTTLDILGNESSFSNPFNLTVNDLAAPGSIMELQATSIGAIGSRNFSLSWIPPDLLHNGSDIAYYQIYISPIMFTAIPGWGANATVMGRLNITISFVNLPDNRYYITIIANDENSYQSSLSTIITYTVDTTSPYILPDSITNVTGSITYVNQPVIINVTIVDLGGISRTFINYTRNGIPQPAIPLTLVASINGSYVYSGLIPVSRVGDDIEYFITVFDYYGHSNTTDTYSYSVVSENKPPVLLYLIVAIVAAVGFSYLRLRSYRTEQRIKRRLDMLIKEPLTPSVSNIEAIQLENTAVSPIETHEPPQNIIQNSIISVDSTSHQDAGEREGFILFVFNSILTIYPTLERMFPQEERVRDLIKIKNLSLEEQLALFGYLIGKNSEKEIRIQLYKLINEFKDILLNGPWAQILPKLENFVDLAQAIGDHTILTEIFLLTLLIRNSIE